MERTNAFVVAGADCGRLVWATALILARAFCRKSFPIEEDLEKTVSRITVKNR